MSQTSHITTSGGLISTAFIENIRQAQTNQRGTQPDTYSLLWLEAPKSPAVQEAKIAETWETLLERWDAIATELPAMDISQARDRWILPFLRALDFQPSYQRGDIVLDDSEALRFNISHFGWDVEQVDNLFQAPPLHTIPPTADLDARPVGAVNSRSAKGKSPHDMLQLFLNVSREHRWAVLTNGLHLRLLRDYHHTYTKGYVEFDLESIFETRNFADFRALYRMVHASRFIGEAVPSIEDTTEPVESWESVPLEMFYRDSQAAGIQVGADLQKQVREAIETLGNGFLLSGGPLLAQLQSEAALCQQFYAELLHLVYRILFLLYAEQRGMVPGSGAPLDTLYRQGYSLTALRSKAESDPASPEAYDLWEGLKVTFKMFRQGAAELGVYRYNGMLFAEDQTPLLDGGGAALRQAQEPERGRGGEKDSPLPPGTPAPLQALRCRNHELLRAIRALTLIEREGVLQRISYADLNVEEIGGIYESLLDFAPRVTTGAEHVEGRNLPPNTFFLDPRGTARKTTGSYYTHPSLVNALIESALMPVLETRLAEVQGSGGAGEKVSRAEKDSPLPPSAPAPLPVDPAAAEQAILSLKVCDPAMGSGHFLIAANNALALRLAQIRSGDDYPAERELRRARRDVLAHCIYGVDLNPMAVELGKVALWINAAVNDAPLSFLDHHLKCGNSLIGATPELLEQGIPDNAFQPVTGDDNSVASAVRRRNKQERSGQLSLWRMTMLETEADLRKWRELNDLAEDEPRLAERRYTEYRADPAYRHNELVADLWTAAFFWPLAEDSDLIPTEEFFRQAQADPALVPGRIKEQAAQLAETNKFFHWHIEFPDVFGEKGNTGFDVVVGNPPWEMMQIDPVAFFRYRASQIASANTTSERDKMIAKLRKTDPELHKTYSEEIRQLAAFRKFANKSGRFRLTSYGRLNIASTFAELFRWLIGRENNRTGMIVPSGIATDAFNQYFFNDLLDTEQIVSLYDFENRLGLFPEVHREQKFSLFTLSGQRVSSAEFAFFLHHPDSLNNSEKVFELSAEDFNLINPNTRTCPIFRSRFDAELTRKIYGSSQVLINEEKDENPWSVNFKLMFMMNTASHLFRTKEQLTAEDYVLNGNRFEQQDNIYLPLYEGKLTQIYDHRAMTFADLTPDEVAKSKTRELSESEQVSSVTLTLPRFWINISEIKNAVSQKKLSSHWLTFHDIANPNNERTFIATICPACGMGNTLPVVLGLTAIRSMILLSCWNNFVFDYVSRLKIGSRHMNFYVVKQLPVLPPDRYTPDLLAYIVPRVLELTYTAWDLRAFADDVWAEAGVRGSGLGVREKTQTPNNEPLTPLQNAILRQWEANRDATHGGHEGATPPDWAESRGSGFGIGDSGKSPNHEPLTPNPEFPKPPFKWDEARRAQLRADLDGLYGHLYNLTRDELAYILATFPIVRRKDEAQYGEYRTKRMVLEVYDELQELGIGG